jgi:lipase chaperone LimK
MAKEIIHEFIVTHAQQPKVVSLLSTFQLFDFHAQIVCLEDAWLKTSVNLEDLVHAVSVL